jgi:hypothetical protein
MYTTGGGIHHVGSLVLSYDSKMKRVHEAGIQILQSGVIKTRGGATTRYAYLDTVKQCGIITELIETRLYKIPVPQNRLFMEIGCLTVMWERSWINQKYFNGGDSYCLSISRYI